MDSKKWMWVAALVVVIALGVMFQQGVFSKDADNYQAVFLSNGQVYFGKARATGDVVVVKDIYYLQVSQQQIQPAPEGQTQQPQVQLVKLGNEIHGPQDEMTINKDHVLFTEDLKEDGKVVKAIRNFQQNGTQATPAQ